MARGVSVFVLFAGMTCNVVSLRFFHLRNVLSNSV